MKLFSVAALLCAASLLTSSCVGSFKLFNKLAGWNKDATGSKFLNELIFILISPAYAVCGVVDVLVLNTIEFWTDSNPLASNDEIGKVRMMAGSDGQKYEIKRVKDGYDIKKENGDIVQFRFDEKTRTWTQIANGKEVKLVSINNDGTVDAYLPNGGQCNIAMDSNGLYEAQQAVRGDLAIAF